MSLQTLMIIGIFVVVGVLVVTLISVNRAYAFKHTIDEKPQQSFNNKKKTE